MFLRVHGQGGPRCQLRVGSMEMRAAKRGKESALGRQLCRPWRGFWRWHIFLHGSRRGLPSSATPWLTDGHGSLLFHSCQFADSVSASFSHPCFLGLEKRFYLNSSCPCPANC